MESYWTVFLEKDVKKDADAIYKGKRIKKSLDKKIKYFFEIVKLSCFLMSRNMDFYKQTIS